MTSPASTYSFTRSTLADSYISLGEVRLGLPFQFRRCPRRATPPGAAAPSVAEVRRHQFHQALLRPLQRPLLGGVGIDHQSNGAGEIVEHQYLLGHHQQDVGGTQPVRRACWEPGAAPRSAPYRSRSSRPGRRETPAGRHGGRCGSAAGRLRRDASGSATSSLSVKLPVNPELGPVPINLQHACGRAGR